MTKRTRLVGPLSVAIAFLWAMLRSGTGVLPGIEGPWVAAQIWPRRLPGEFEGFLSDSPLGLMTYQALQLETSQQYYLLHLVAIVGAIAAIAAWAFTSSETTASKWKAARLTILAPISAVLLAWIGSYDSFTMLAWALALFAWRSGRVWLMGGAGVILGFQHFEHAILGVLALSLAWMATRSFLPTSVRVSNPLWVLPGIFIGKIALLGVFVISGEKLTSREAWIAPFLWDWTTVGINIAPLLLWSLFAGFWAVLVVLFLAADARARWLFGAMMIVGLVALILSGDRPRVFVVVLAPAVALIAVAFAHSIRGREGRVIEAVVWIGVPILFWAKDVANENVVDLMVIAWQVLRA